MRRLARNVARLGFEGVLPVVADLAAAPAVRGPFHRVLVDAPCSGTGTFRRRPELRARLRPEDLLPLAARQGILLDRAAALVPEGGVLVYSVCSIEPEEGEGVVRAFLRRHPEFRLDDPGPWLPASAGRFAGSDGIVRTVSEPEALDGFQAARLVRRYHGAPADAGSSAPETVS
jgi:16S rRNA (cytosine967-C5)-methyltransferase